MPTEMIRAGAAALLLALSVVLSGCDAAYWCSDDGGDPLFGQPGEGDHPCSDSEMRQAGYEQECGRIRGPEECWWER